MARDGEPDPDIAPLPDEPVHALSLAADDDAHRLREVELPWSGLAANVEGGAPDARALDLGNCGGDARDVRDAQQLARPRARLDRRRRQGRAAMLGDDRAGGAGNLRAAEDGAKVLRVHDPIERNEQRRSEIKPSSAADFVINFVADPAQGSALGERGHESDGDPPGDRECKE